MKATHILLSATLLAACGSAEDPSDQGQLQSSSTASAISYAQPFLKSAVWNLMLPPASSRSETPLPSGIWSTGGFVPNDDPSWGTAMYVAKSTDPSWTVTASSYNDARTGWTSNHTFTMHIPSGLKPPAGGDGMVLVVDPLEQYAYEMWQVTVSSGSRAHASDVEVVDLHGSGLNGPGITGAGLPATPGILKALDMQSGAPIRHKLWLAGNPAIFYGAAVWPASSHDCQGTGSHAFFKEGDVVALSKSFNVSSNECALSANMQRIAHTLQDFGGIMEDQSSDGITVEGEIGSLQNYLGNEYWNNMWTEFDCLKKHLVKVNNPWTGAPQSGLGY